MTDYKSIIDCEPPAMNHWYIPEAPMTLCALLIDDINDIEKVTQHGMHGAVANIVLCQICLSILRIELDF